MVDTQKKKKEEKEIITNRVTFNSFMGANLLIGVTIPFSIKVPFSAHPSCSVEYPSINKSDDYGYIQHFLIVEVPCLSVKRIMSIIIKNNIKFTYQNKLLKIP